MSLSKIKKQKIFQQLAEFGYFSEQLPPCFNSKMYSDNIFELTKHIGSMTVTSPVSLSIYKNEKSRRIISVPNPKEFTRTLNLYKSNWNTIRRYTKSNNSHSKITKFDYSYNEFIDSIVFKDVHQIGSGYLENLLVSIVKSAGYRYCLKVDIANFYNSIYTHSISWAICGKEEAKKMFFGKITKSKDYILSEELDTHMCSLKSNETNGIIVGPYTSRIFSEILLAKVDQELGNLNLRFTRYVDDYNFYFKSRLEIQNNLPKIQAVLSKYNLALNESKTEILEFPYHNYSNMSRVYKLAYEENNILGVLNEAGILFNNGEKGAYKYALKLFENTSFPTEQAEAVLALLVNILLLAPQHGRYVIPYIIKNIDTIGKEKISVIINEELVVCSNNNLQQETLMLLYLAREIEMNIDGNALLNILKSGDDFSIIIALDIWKNHYERIQNSTFFQMDLIDAVHNVFNALKSCDYLGEHWLLLYESEIHNLNPNKDYVYPEKDDFFKKMKELNITFYS